MTESANRNAKGTGHIHYAWWMFIGCCFTCAGSMACTLSIVGVYMLPVSTSLGVNPGEFMVWMTLTSVGSIIANPIWGRLMQTRNINAVMSASVILLVLSLVMFSFGTSVTWWCIWGFVLGVAMPPCGTLGAPTLIGNWFSERKRGTFMGIATAFTGLGTFVWSPLFTQIILSFGWQTAYLANAALVAVFCLPWTLFVYRFRPEDKGLRPYGYEEGGESDANETLYWGMDAKKALATLPLWFVLIGVCVASIGMGFNSNQVGIATEVTAGMLSVEEAAMLGASMISAAAAGNIVGKILFGWLSPRAGLTATFIIFCIMFLAGFLLWLFVPSTIALLVGAFLFGTHNGIVAVGIPLLTRTLFGNRNYAKIYSYATTAGALMGGFSSSIIAAIYGFTGSYHNALLAALVLVAVLFVVCFGACRFIGKLPWTDRDGNPVPAATR